MLVLYGDDQNGVRVDEPELDDRSGHRGDFVPIPARVAMMSEPHTRDEKPPQDCSRAPVSHRRSHQNLRGRSASCPTTACPKIIADAAPGTLDALSLSSPILVLEQKRGETMRRAIPLLVLTLMAAAAVQAQFDWAYQSTDEVLPQRDLEADEQAPRTLPGGKLARTQAEIDDPWSPPDWFPGDHHAPVPEIVARGAGENVRACAQCHGFAGSGHPESSHLTGLTVNYIVRQMAEFKTGARKDRFWMNRFAPFVTDVQVLAAAEWYAGIEARDLFERHIVTE